LFSLVIAFIRTKNVPTHIDQFYNPSQLLMITIIFWSLV